MRQRYAALWLETRISGVELGLPEYDDRLAVWRVALITCHHDREPVGEVRLAKGKVIFSAEC